MLCPIHTQHSHKYDPQQAAAAETEERRLERQQKHFLNWWETAKDVLGAAACPRGVGLTGLTGQPEDFNGWYLRTDEKVNGMPAYRKGRDLSSDLYLFHRRSAFGGDLPWCISLEENKGTNAWLLKCDGCAPPWLPGTTWDNHPEVVVSVLSDDGKASMTPREWATKAKADAAAKAKKAAADAKKAAEAKAEADAAAKKAFIDQPL